MIFNAGSSTAAGTSTGGNIIISSSPTFTTGSGGRMTYYTGSISGSTGLTSLIGSGSNRFRYNSDETTTNYSAALSSGKYAIYREQPTLTITADDETVTYSTTPSESVTITGMQNGDASATVVTTDASISISGDTSTSGNYIVGDHTITPSAAASTYGYGFSYSTGTLTVDAKALTIGGITASNKTYNGNTTATIDVSAATFSGLVVGDDVTVSATGTFDNKNVGTGKTVTLVETNAGDDVGNYTITDQGSTTANITAKTLTATASASNKVYDGNTTASVTLTFTGLVGDETLGQTVGATFADKNVANAKTVTVNSITLSDDGGLASNYTISTGQTTTANITPKALTIGGITASNKTYNGNTTATIDVSAATFSGLVVGDDVTVSATGTFDNKNVGTGKTVTLVETNAGDDVGNYTITDQGSTTANITAKTLTATASASNKVYDGNTTASVTLTFTGLVGDETLGQTVGATFADKNVANAKTVTVNSITLSDDGGLASNYTISTGQTTTANITPKALTIGGITASNKTYNGNTTATIDVSAATFSGLVVGDDVTVSATGTFDNKNVGTGKTVTLVETNAGDDVGNYTITDQGSTTANITAKTLTATASASNKVYDGNTTASVTLTFTGLVGDETLGQTVGATFADKNVANAKTVTVNSITLSDDGGLASNYTISTGQTTTANITPKALTIGGITASNKTYNGNTTATIDVSAATFSGLVVGDDVTVSATGTFDNKNVGTGKTVTLVETNAGDDVGNYTITDQGSTTANITAKTLTATASASNKVYDGNTTASVTLTFTGLVGDETLGQTVGATFADKNVANAKTVTVNSITLSDDGGLASNYTISTGQTTTANITPKALTIGGITASNKTYNGNTTATIDVSAATFSGLVVGDDVTVSATGTFDNKNVGTGKTVTLVETNAGDDVGNYTITDQGSTTANITAKTLTATASASNKVYDGNTTASVTLTFTGLVGDETLGQTVGATFADKNVANAKTVTVNSITLSDDGGLASNYTISTGQTTTANITPKALTIGGITASNKTYNGNTTATIDVSAATFSGLVVGDDVTVSATGTFDNKNVGTGKTVTLVETNAGDDVGNYTITDQGSTTANITAKTLTATASASNKVYDGNTTASVTLTFTGLVGDETLGQTVGATFADKNVANAKTVTVNSITLSDDGGLASNYTISTGQTTTANITPKALTIGGITASNKTYNGNTTATIDVSAATFSGLVVGDDVTVSATGTFDNKNVGTGKTVTLVETNAGDDVGNYTITDQGSTTANITAKTLTATASASNKVYDGNTTASVTLTFTGLVGDETLGQTVGATFADKNVANAKTVTVNSITLSDDGGLASNYTISTGQTTTANITPKALTIGGITASNKTYNGNTTATIDVSAATFSGLVVGDDVTVSATGTFDNKNVGTGKTVTLVETNAGDDVGNYTITDQGSTTANITQLSSVTWNGNAGDGLWSSASNWAGSAIPDQNNVATAVIPSDESVTFDSDTVGTIGSTITNNGTLTFNGATDYTFGQVISGSGALVKSNTNTLTLSATNTFTGDTTISAGTIKLTGSVNAATDLSIASGATLDLQATQTFATLDLDGTITRSAGSSALTITGASDIGGSITTSGTQDYEDSVVLTSNVTLTTTNSNVTFDSTIKGCWYWQHHF
jgi:hypothetical protein